MVAGHRVGGRWVRFETGRDPAADRPDGPADDIPSFEPAGAVWLAYRAGTTDPTRYGGAAAIRDAVFRDLAHANGDAVGLTDTWGGMGPDLVDDLDVVDEIAALLVAASAGDAVAEREMAERYTTDPRLHPPRARSHDG